MIQEKIGKYTLVRCGHCGMIRKVAAYPWLRDRRMKYGISLRAMSKRMGFSAAYISDVELGRRLCTKTILKFYEELKP